MKTFAGDILLVSSTFLCANFLLDYTHGTIFTRHKIISFNHQNNMEQMNWQDGRWELSLRLAQILVGIIIRIGVSSSSEGWPGRRKLNGVVFTLTPRRMPVQRTSSKMMSQGFNYFAFQATPTNSVFVDDEKTGKINWARVASSTGWSS